MSGEDIALLYRARWEVGLVFKELKSRYSLDIIPSMKPAVVEAFIWIGILTLLCSRCVFLMVRSVNPKKAKRFTYMLWAKVFAKHAHGLMRSIIESNDLEYSLWTWLDIFESHARDPNVERDRLMEDWVV